MKKILVWSLLGVCSVIGTNTPAATQFPDKTVHLVVPFPPGGGADILGRAMAQKLGEKWGQAVVIDNRGGAGGNIGTDFVARAPAGTPKPIIDKLNTDVVAVLQSAEIKTFFASQGADVIADSPEHASAKVRSEVIKWRNVIAAINLKLD